MLLKCCTQYVSKFGKLSSGHRTGKGQLSFQSQRRAMLKDAEMTTLLYSFHMLARLCSKAFKLGFSSTWTKNFQMYKLGFTEAEEPQTKLPTFVGSRRRKGSSGKTSTSASLTTLKPLTVWIKQTRRVLKRWGYQTTFPASWEICMQVKKQLLELDMEKWTGSKSRKEYVKAVYCHLAYLIYMQSTSCKMLCQMTHRLEPRFPGEISTTSDLQMMPL